MVLERNSTGDEGKRGNSTPVTRRRALQVGLLGSLSLAGCLDDDSSSDTTDDTEPEADSADDDDETAATDDDTADADQEESAGDDDDGHDDEPETEAVPDGDPEDVIYAYFMAAVDEDIDRMSELSHSLNPLDPAAWVEDGWEFRGGGEEEDIEDVETDVRTEDATLEEFFELEGTEFWFEEDDLEDALGGAGLALIEVTADDPTEDDMVWVMAPEDGAWRYLFAAAIDDTPDDPEEAFEEPIEDEDDDVVVEVDWEHESDMSDIPQAAVVLTDERGIEANRIEVESTIEGASSGAFDQDDDEFEANWEGITLYVPYNEDGDQIVVTAINEAEDESEIVHREHYEP